MKSLTLLVILMFSFVASIVLGQKSEVQETQKQPKTVDESEMTGISSLSILQVKRIYVVEIDSATMEAVEAGVLKKTIELKMRKKFRRGKTGPVPVESPEYADPVLKCYVTYEEEGDGLGKSVGRYLNVSDSSDVVVELVDHAENLIWETEKGDRSLFWGPLGKRGPKKLADRIVKELDKSIKNAKKWR